MKKIVSLVLSSILLVTIFSSCGAKDNSANSSLPEEQSNTSETSSSSSDEGQSSEPTDKVTFKEEDLAPENEEDEEILNTYVYPYSVTNFFGKQFSPQDKSELDGDFLMTMFISLHMKNGEGYPTVEGTAADEPIKVEADVIENGILSQHFELSAEEIKEKCADYYNEEDNTYNTIDGLGGGPRVFKITDSKNEDGVLTFSYEWYSPADGEGTEFELYRTGTMSIKQTDEGFVFISNESKEV